MLSHVHGPTDIPLLTWTIGAALDRAADLCGERDALVCRHQQLRYTYRELLGEVNRAARALMALGIEKGDRVAIWSPNAAEWLITQYAAAKTGAILVNVNPAYRIRELEYALNQSGVRVLVAARAFRKTDYVEMLTTVAPSLTSIERVVFFGPGPVSGGVPWPEFMAGGDGVRNDDLRARESLVSAGDAANIQYTSGTTGAPKGATLSHANILNNGYFVGEILKYTAEDRICTPVPFYHCFGCVMANLAALTHGAAVVVPADAFDPGATLATIDEERCTSVYGVPTMFIAQLEHPSLGSVSLDSLRTGIMAGAPCPIEVMRQVMDRMHVPEMTICYGMTETSPVSFQSAVDDPIELRVASVGRVHPHIECKIVDPLTGGTVPSGVAGELCTRGYSVMIGYWNDAAATAAAIDAGGWMHSGDLAVMREDGTVNIAGRIKDIIIRGGENISPREIEEFLYTHPKVSDVQVVGVPDVRYGEEICAWVRLRDGQHATEDELRSFCHGQIATYKIPKYIQFISEFPTTVTQKVQKFRLREMAIAALGLGGADGVQTA